jgi:ABC-type phosphate/phosphonate transport system substrate-binding protein
MTLIANARMYSVSPSAAAAWRALLARVIEESGVAMDIIDHAYPATLNDLWARSDLGCALMCGWPFVREGSVKTLLAAPVPAAAWAGGQPVYRSDFIVARDASFARLEDTFGHRFAFNTEESHSGYNAPRAHLAKFAAHAPLFRELVGPLVTYQRVVAALADGAAEVAAIDSLSLEMIRRHAPELAAKVRVIDATATSPIPAFVASGLGVEEAARVRAALLRLNASESGRRLLSDVCLTGFVEVDPERYQATQEMTKAAIAQKYPMIT